jgi:hypothetical protein
MNRFNKKIILLSLALFGLLMHAHSANIVYPWRSTTAIVLSGDSFEVWFNADAGQTVTAIQLAGPYHSVNCQFTYTTGDWEYDPLSGNRYNMSIAVTVPVDAPADRYDLVLKTTTGEVISYGGVKVLKEYKQDYYIMHMSDGHLYQYNYDTNTLLARKTAMIDMANIMDCQLIIETGDNMYNVRNHPEREVIYFQGNDSEGLKGMADATAATFLVPGDHDAHTGNDWPQATVQVNSDFFNDYWGMQNANFKYGNGRFMMLNNAWAVSETSGGVHQYQADDAAAWLLGEGNAGNFFVTAGHCYNKLHEFIDDTEPLDLVLAGDKHHIRTDNPYSFDDGSPEVAYIAGSIRDHFEFNLFRVNNETGTYTPVSGTNAVVEVLQSGNQDDRETWVPNLTLEFQDKNDGSSYENTATITNKFDFPILGAKIRFVMPRGYDFRVDNATITQEFDGDAYRVIDVTLDVAANSSEQVFVGDADQCPDDPDKTEPGMCGCGVPEGTCETSSLIVNRGSGSGDYYPYESVTIVAESAAEGEVFDAWVIISGNPMIDDMADPETELLLHGSPAEVTATYAEIPLVNDASFVSQLIPPMVPGGNVAATVTMRNTGTTSWTRSRGYMLGSQLPPGNTTWGVSHVDLAETDSIVPGAEKTFTFDITAPATEGPWDFQWQMMQADSGYFGVATFQQTIRLTGSDAYLDDCDLATAWKSSGTLQLNSTGNMQGSNCLQFTGGGADEFKKTFSTPYNTRGSEAGSMLQFWYFVSDVSKLEGSNQVELGSAGKPDNDEYNWRMEGLANGWNYIRLPISEAGILGNPDLTEINWFRLYSFKSAAITTKIDAIQLISDGIYTEVQLTVNHGEGSGAYEPGDRVRIRADAAATGEVFDEWIIHSGTPQLDDPNAATTYLTISDTDAEVSASYIADPNVSVSSADKLFELSIYPVPAHETLHFIFGLEEPSGVSVNIRDLAGRVLIQHPRLTSLDAGENHFTMDIAELSTGSYLVEVQMNHSVNTRMIVVI